MLAANQPDTNNNFMNHGNDNFLNLKHWLKNRLSSERRAALRRHLVEPLGFVFRRDQTRVRDH